MRAVHANDLGTGPAEVLRASWVAVSGPGYVGLVRRQVSRTHASGSRRSGLSLDNSRIRGLRGVDVCGPPDSLESEIRSRKAADDGHRTRAFRTGRRIRRRDSGRSNRWERRFGQDLTAAKNGLGPLPVGEYSEVADANKTARQYMQ